MASPRQCRCRVPLQIASLSLTNPIVAAPLAGISHLPHRLLAKAAGCGLVYSEMISANGLVQKSAKTHALLASNPVEKPLAVQIFGADPAVLAEAAEIVENAGADIVDLNFGCSVKKVLKTGAGAALLAQPDLTRKILRAVRQAVRIPLTIKIRTGWDPSGEQALQTLKIAEDCGVDAAAIHPRTALQGFSGRADWRLITAAKSAVKLPIIGNGDVDTPAAAERMLVETGCDAVMIGRAAIGNPWIFSRVAAQLLQNPVPTVKLQQRREVMLHYMHRLVEAFGEFHGCRMMRSQLGWFAKGLPFSRQFRDSIKQLATLSEATRHIESYFEALSEHAQDSLERDAE